MHTPAPRTIEAVLSPRFLSQLSSLSKEAQQASVVIGICIRNQARHLPAALASAMDQQVIRRGEGVVVILDDASDDNWQAGVDHWLNHPHVVVIGALCGTAARARNALLDWVDAELPAARWVARLDADDRFAEKDSVGTLVQAGEKEKACYVLGSNHLEAGGQQLSRSNIADPDILKNRSRLLAFVEGFGLHNQQQELPSCNLLLRTRSGIRYPDVISAEDHWLVTELLMLYTHQGVVVSAPVYSVYSLGGAVTEHNRRSSHWQEQRRRLATAARYWHDTLEQPVSLLGVGQEGVVWREGGSVYKQFYPHAMDDGTVLRLRGLVATPDGPVPSVQWQKQVDDSWRCRYPWFDSVPLPRKLSLEAARQFLIQQYRCGYVTSNIKRSNLRLVDGRLLYIDIGKDIVAFTPTRFLDAAARLYTITVLGQSDYELARRFTARRQHEALGGLPGFSAFYRGIIETLFPHCAQLNDTPLSPLRTESRVTLLIKCCAQDAELLADQVPHIVSQLSYPVAFARTVLLVDPYTGPFLRQFAQGNLSQVLAIAEKLQTDGIVDEVWQAPTQEAEIRQAYLRWFGRSDITASHTTIGAPLFSQLWAFDQIDTPYVLQCDSDVLVGRRELKHDYLGEMVAAMTTDGVVSVGFNIPQPKKGFKAYQGESGIFAPEIRCGLLHLPRLRDLCPLPNSVVDGQYELMWHRSVQMITAQNCRSVRGGDSRTFYLHPMNQDKASPEFSTWRDLVAQGLEPFKQKGAWDLLPGVNWCYPQREEALVFLLKGRGTSLGKLRRSLGSLAMQHDQRFGVIVIDDGSSFEDSWYLPLLLGALRNRTTLIRRRERFGYIRNFRTAVKEICRNPDTLIVTLDLDDALMSPDVVSRLHVAIRAGTDLINGGMFRPDKPLHLYEPDYQTPRNKGGGNVWSHLRGFRKRLFDMLPDHYLQHQGKWVDSATDYALMLPLSELSQQPVFIDNLFCYYHQREPYSDARKANQQAILDELFSLPPAQTPDAAALASIAGESCR